MTSLYVESDAANSNAVMRTVAAIHRSRFARGFPRVGIAAIVGTVKRDGPRVPTDRHYLLAVLKNYHPDLVVIESCGLAG